MMKLKKILKILIAFLLPVSVISLYVILSGHKFSDLLIGDAYQQYVYLFDYFKDVLNGKNSILWSFSRGMGGNMLGVYFYYLSSPLNLLLYFVPRDYIPSFIPILSIIKIGLCGLTMYYYLSKRTKNNYLINLTFSTSYALMSYNIVYLFCTMWLDVVYLAPLVLLGIDKMIDREKNANIFYIIFLSLSIFSNYYISYMLCIFCVIYFLFRLFTNENIKDNKIRKKIALNFILSSLFCGLLLAFELLPVLNEFKYLYRDDVNKYNPSVLKAINEFLFSLNNNPLNNDVYFKVPNIFTNYFVIYILINYLFFSKINKEKIWFMFLILVFCLSFVFPKMEYVWHGFSYPILYIHRQAFLLNLLLIIMCGQKVANIKRISNKNVIIIALVYTIISFLNLLLYKFAYNFIFSIYNIFFIVSTIYIINLTLKNDNKKYYISIIILIISQIILQLKYNLSFFDYKYKYFNSTIYNLNSNIDENDIIRVNGLNYSLIETVNSKYSNIYYFLSNNNLYVSNFLKKSGYYVISNVIQGNKSQEFINDILGVKYYYEINEKKHFQIEKNENALEIGYMINKNEIILNESNPFEYQNYISKYLTNLKIYKKIKIINNLKKEVNVNMKDKNLYMYIKPKVIINTPQVKLNGKKTIYESVTKINDNIDSLNFEIGKPELVNISIPKVKLNGKNLIYENITKTNDDIENFNFEIDKPELIEGIYIYSLNEENMKKSLDILSENQIYDSKINKNEMTFKIDNINKETLLLTIPYDKGYEVYVDGKKTNYYKILDAFIGIDLKKGTHSIKIKYIPEGLKLGIIISLLTFISSIIYIVVKKCKKNS